MEHRCMFHASDMKRSASQLALEAFLAMSDHNAGNGNTSTEAHDCHPSHVSMAFKNLDIMEGVSDYSGVGETAFWSQKFTPKQATIDCQSSICENLSADSPVSANKPEGRSEQARRAASGSSHEQTDDEDGETEAGQCEQSNDPNDIKRLRRMVSNRESARRSRQRKQAHLADLELQVEQLRGENASLYKQLIDATHQYRDADTNNRVLKSDVEALRAKVKLAEDLVARGSSLSSNLNQLLQTHLSLPQPINNLRLVANASPTIQVHAGHNSGLGLGNVASDAVSCVSEIWP